MSSKKYAIDPPPAPPVNDTYASRVEAPVATAAPMAVAQSLHRQEVYAAAQAEIESRAARHAQKIARKEDKIRAGQQTIKNAQHDIDAEKKKYDADVERLTQLAIEEANKPRDEYICPLYAASGTDYATQFGLPYNGNHFVSVLTPNYLSMFGDATNGHVLVSKMKSIVQPAETSSATVNQTTGVPTTPATGNHSFVTKYSFSAYDPGNLMRRVDKLHYNALERWLYNQRKFDIDAATTCAKDCAGADYSMSAIVHDQTARNIMSLNMTVDAKNSSGIMACRAPMGAAEVGLKTNQMVNGADKHHVEGAVSVPLYRNRATNETVVGGIKLGSNAFGSSLKNNLRVANIGSALTYTSPYMNLDGRMAFNLKSSQISNYLVRAMYNPVITRGMPCSLGFGVASSNTCADDVDISTDPHAIADPKVLTPKFFVDFSSQFNNRSSAQTRLESSGCMTSVLKYSLLPNVRLLTSIRMSLGTHIPTFTNIPIANSTPNAHINVPTVSDVAVTPTASFRTSRPMAPIDHIHTELAFGLEIEP